MSEERRERALSSPSVVKDLEQEDPDLHRFSYSEEFGVYSKQREALY